MWADLTDEDKKALASRDGGSFTLHGTVDGWDSGTDITVTVTSAQVTVVWSNGDTEQVPVTWNTDQVKSGTVGTYTATATVEGKDVTLTVKVVDVSITGVTNPAEITATSGATVAQLGLPATVKADLNNGTTADVAVRWANLSAEQAAILASREGGAFMLSGTVNGWDKPVTVKVTVSRASVTTAALAEEDAAVTTPSGTNPTLPATATVTWSNGDTTQETITWPELTDEQKAVVAARQGGSFTITGTVEGQDVTAKVTVSPALRLAVRAAQTGQPVGASLLITAKVTVTAASTPKPTDKPTTQSTVRLVDRTRRDRRR